ncbi:MAG: hypothetical protein EXR07_06985 [Acetobacteraceae bacterium]|nr:hypothetical protein [Acetobacteraceae bacterium]
MTLDLIFCLLAGVLSCLTPEALLLFPLLLGAIGASGSASAIMTAAGLGLALVANGAMAEWLGTSLGFEAMSLRWLVCALLILQGIVLMRRSLVERLPLLTGGLERVFDTAGIDYPGGVLRQFLLALLVGANWMPRLGPMLGKASLMAADARNFRFALLMLFVFGVGAALPWLVSGRVARLLVRPIAGGLLRGMAGKRLLGLTLVCVAFLGLTGNDVLLVHWIDTMSPDWARKLAVTF